MARVSIKGAFSSIIRDMSVHAEMKMKIEQVFLFSEFPAHVNQAKIVSPGALERRCAWDSCKRFLFDNMIYMFILWSRHNPCNEIKFELKACSLANFSSRSVDEVERANGKGNDPIS